MTGYFFKFFNINDWWSKQFMFDQKNKLYKYFDHFNYYWLKYTINTIILNMNSNNSIAIVTFLLK